ncbi:Antioxidant, AhpC/Tsa family [Rubellimicrobium mesophilum DSM 19309]|uniref:Glutathione-dependent peroxiredoxin n=1 Tax=Rubellimicrobium mesophilum DSM 19309 TaxID=442562 RepID=A0A017HV43_9RHOB|nr:peroxiredoxin [Rubellimicrobium mesophilum]EYD78377.1 Antioxidant, AhpC/Tsa family [Rubellimicrobium mesophilum DSM 19309]
MAIEVGERLPEGTLLRRADGRNEEVPTRDLFANRRVVLFGVPGAFTGTCSTAHVPSYMRVMAPLAARGVDEVVCVSVNDPWVMQAWGESTGATMAGITLLADPSGDWVEALGQSFTYAPSGFYGRCRRFSALVEDGVVRIWHEELGAGVCEATAGEAMLAAMA